MPLAGLEPALARLEGESLIQLDDKGGGQGGIQTHVRRFCRPLYIHSTT